MKKTTVTTLFYLCLFFNTLIGQGSLIYEADELLVMFSPTASQQDIAQIMNTFNATELDVTDELEVRQWKLQFPIYYNVIGKCSLRR